MKPVRSQTIPASIDEAWKFFADPHKLIFAAAVLSLVIAGCAKESSGTPLRLVASTSFDNSGLAEALTIAWENESGERLETLSAGSGRAFDILRAGDADAAITHEPNGESKLLRELPDPWYRKFMCTDFLIAGPEQDPARVEAAESPLDAMIRIARSGSPFISRADDSGTHVRESSLWAAAGVAPEPSLLVETGQGMAGTLRIASERSGYLLTDRATFLKLENTLRLEPLFSDPSENAMLNCYALTIRRGRPRSAEAIRFGEWITRGSGRKVIEDFSIEGEKPFRAWPEGRPDSRPDDLPR
ncbi:MAG: substrate-binding domain-containing protein [Acidobacteria bacterium]|nr:substrate-binding domain-containing protein [Acidobacteriota bacterium]